MGLRRRFAAITLAAIAGTCIVPSSVTHAASSNPVRAAFPAQWNATETTAMGSRHWALLIGITDYAPGNPLGDTIGGKRDALQLKAHLRSLGWREDHILVLTNRNATKAMINGAIAWLKWKSSSRSTAVFAFSGHEMPFRTTADGDDEARDVSMMTYDNRYILDGHLARKLGDVPARAMWIHLATCRAGGFNDPGLSKPGRVITFASPESELSYEDPKVDMSVFGNYTVVEGMREELGDLNDDGLPTVEEAFRFAKPRVHTRTGDRQHPFMIDRVEGSLSLVPAKPVI
jgi:hypothetical protein